MLKSTLKWVAVGGLLAICWVSLHRDGMLHVPHKVLYSHYRLISRVKGEGIACGTGIAISRREILTAAHVVDGGETFELDIFDKDGKEIKTIQLVLVSSGQTTLYDLALLRASEDLPFYNELDDDDPEFEVGKWGYTIGCAHATVPYNVYFGMLSSKYGPNHLSGLSQIAITVPPGQSGGGVYTAVENRLLGVVVRSREGYSLFVPMSIVRDFLSSIPNRNEPCLR